MTQYYTNEHLGQSQFYFWYGQVLGDWEGNENNTIHLRNDIPGWGKRYKVAILGRDQRAVDSGAGNNEIAMAEVLLPVTAGSGLGGGTQTPNIAQNTFVVGFYKDGVNCREPIIMGLLPNFTQTICIPYNGNDLERFNPASGFNPANSSHYVPDYNLWTEQGNHIIKESNDSGYVNGLDARNKKQLDDGKVSDYIPTTSKCNSKGGEMSGIAKIIQDGMNLINKIKNSVLGFSNAISSIERTIKSVVSTITLYISTLVKNMIQRMRGYMHNQINRAVSSTLALIPPNMRASASVKVETSMDVLNCVFNKIIGKLIGLVETQIVNLITGAVNAGMQVAENFVGGLLSSLLGGITGGIGGALGAIGGVFGKALNIAGKALDALDMVFGFLKFFTCEEEIKCPNIKQWSFWYGANEVTQQVSDKVGTVLNNIANTTNGKVDPKLTAPVLSGPPTLQLEGGGGSGFKANAVISSSGKIIAFDIVDPGSGYTSTPIPKIYNPGGVGRGAVLMPVVSK